jgi:hypothetical protein
MASPTNPIKCKVLGCSNIPIDNNYCPEHKALFTPTAAAVASNASSNNNNTNSKSNHKYSNSNSNSTVNNILASSPKNSDNLLKEVRASWLSAARVVFKDVPRLSKRISIQTTEGIEVILGRAQQNDKNLLEEVICEKPKNSVTSVAQAEKLIRELSLTRTESLEARENNDENTEISSNNDNNVAVEEKQPISAPNRRISLTASDIREEKLPDISSWDALTNVVTTVVRHCESAEILEKTNKAFKEFGELVEKNNGADLETYLQEILTNSVGLSSKSFAVFRAIHQSILFPAIFHLKTQLYSKVGAMKDVRREDGWLVVVYLGSGNISVTHTRWEQSLEDSNSPNKFECQWEIRLNFDREMGDLRAVLLKIQELKFAENMGADRKAEILNILKGGGYIV